MNILGDRIAGVIIFVYDLWLFSGVGKCTWLCFVLPSTSCVVSDNFFLFYFFQKRLKNGIENPPLWGN